MSPVSRRVFLGAVTATAVTASACSPDEPAASGPSTTGSATASTPPGTTSSPGPTSPPGTPSAPPTTPATGSPAADLLHGPRTRPAVALTFHGAGDPSLTRTVLRIAAEHSAGLTVLAVGSWLDGEPDAGLGDPRRRARAGQPHLEPPADAPAEQRRRRAREVEPGGGRC